MRLVSGRFRGCTHKLPKYLLGGYSSAPSGIPNDLKLELTDYLRNALDECKTALDLNAGYETYERELDRRNLLDFDGLVVKTVERSRLTSERVWATDGTTFSVTSSRTLIVSSSTSLRPLSQRIAYLSGR